MALTYNNQFEAEIRKEIEAERTDKLKNLELGGSATDYAAYREQVGYLRALREVEELCDTVRTRMENR